MPQPVVDGVGLEAAVKALNPWLIAAALALCRSGPLLLGLPFVGWMGRLLLLFGSGAFLSNILLPQAAAQWTAVRGQLLPNFGLWQLAPLFAHELGVGILLLLLAGLPWTILRAAGQVIEQDLFFNTDPPMKDEPIAQLCGHLALSLFFILGGAPAVILALSKSYDVAPIGQGPSLGNEQSVRLLAFCGQIFSLSLALSLPVLAARLLAQLGFGLALRKLEQVPRGIQVLCGLLAFCLGIVVILPVWQNYVRNLPQIYFINSG